MNWSDNARLNEKLIETIREGFAEVAEAIRSTRASDEQNRKALASIASPKHVIEDSEPRPVPLHTHCGNITRLHGAHNYMANFGDGVKTYICAGTPPSSTPSVPEPRILEVDETSGPGTPIRCTCPQVVGADGPVIDHLERCPMRTGVPE